MVGPGDVARPARAAALEGIMHRFEHHGMLPHPEVIVGAPDDHLVVQAMIKGEGKRSARRSRSAKTLYRPSPRILSTRDS